MVDGLEKRGYTRDQVAQICSARPQKLGEAAKAGAQEEPKDTGGSSPAKVGGAAATDRLMERSTPIKIDDPIEFIRGYWKVTWRVTNVPNVPSRAEIWRFEPKGDDRKIEIGLVILGTPKGATRPQLVQSNEKLTVMSIRGGLRIDSEGVPKTRTWFIDIASATSRDALRGGSVEHNHLNYFSETWSWPLIGELDFERIPEDKLVEVLKALN